MPYMNASIKLSAGCWIGASVFVGPGVVIGIDSVVMVGSIVTSSLESGQVFSGNPCIKIGPRWRD